MVYATARRILPSPDQAEDVTQQSFLKLAQDGGARKSLPGWLHRVATNFALTLLRTETRRTQIESLRVHAAAAPAEASWQEVEPLIDAALEALPFEQRVPVIEHFLEGRTHDAIARDLGLTREAVGYRIRTGIEGIRAFLRKHGLDATAAMLAAGFAAVFSPAAEALPGSVASSLGKIAIGGAPLSHSGKAAGLAAAGMRSYALWGVIAMALLTGGIFLATRSDGGGVEPHANPAPPVVPPIAEAEKPEAEKAPPAAASEPVAAESESTETGAPAPTGRRIAGIVVDDTGKPVAGAEVLLICHPESEADSLARVDDRLGPDWWQAPVSGVLTAADGRFEFTDVPEGVDASLTVFKKGLYANEKWLSPEGIGGVKSPDKEDALVVKLASGAVLHGVVYARDGAPVSDGVVSVYHSYNTEGHAGNGGFAATDADGHFRLPIHGRATEFTLRVNSVVHGQQFFSRVRAAAGGVELRYVETCSVRGTITWTDGSPAAGVVVCVDAEVPEPREIQMYSGWRSRIHIHTATGPGGEYEITALHPGFLWHIFVVDPAGGPTLSPQWEHRFELKPGETKSWDWAITRRIRVAGRVLTQRTGTPVPRISIGVTKDGKLLPSVHCETDAEGKYELFVNSGPGTYVIAPTPEGSWEDMTALIADSFGKTLELAGGEDLTLDLEMFEPIELAVRVLTSAGKPASAIQATVNVQLPAGKRFGMGSSYQLDAEGRHTFRIYHPVKQLSLEVTNFPTGPMVTLGPFTPAEGTTLPEEKIILPPVCSLKGTLLDATGAPHAAATVEILARFSDGTSQKLHARTDEQGRFAVKETLRAVPVTLHVSAKGQAEWTSAPLEPQPDEDLSLGDIVLGN